MLHIESTEKKKWYATVKFIKIWNEIEGNNVQDVSNMDIFGENQALMWYNIKEWNQKHRKSENLANRLEEG